MTAMDRKRFARLQELFDQALERPEGERSRFIEEACADDADLAARIHRLLRAGMAAVGDAFVTAAVRSATLALGDDDHSGLQLGPYRLVREIGHGGMGSVWLAERVDDAYRAQVAIKLVRGAFANPELARRFRSERQILADLHHTHIASLLDGGEAPDGTPYLVMEYIDGEPITTWATERRLRLGERLRLFLQVCDAVQHAHGSLIVHRDIKPSNVLVGADGAPKLVDFGIAKLLDADVPSDVTMLAPRLTPGYASPEQLRGERITVATDIYSLGVLLYMLLTDVHPFAADGPSTDEVRRRVLETDPARPGDVLRRRRAGGGVTARSVRGDLDTIVLKALRKEPERRYGTVAALVDDLRRHLSGRPVLARRETFGYVAGKFARRHRAAMAGMAGVVLLVGALTTIYTLRLARERDQARAAAVRANRVVQFLKGVFLQASPEVREGRTATAPQLLARGVSQIDTELAGEPATEVDLKNVMGDVYRGLGMYAEAEAQLEGALRIHRRAHLPADTVLADIYSNLSVVSRVAGDYVAADTFARKGVDLMRGLAGTDNPAYASVLNNLAEAKRDRGQYPAAEALYLQDLAIRRRILPPGAHGIEDALNNLSLVYLDEGKYARAVSVQRRALAMLEALGAPYRFEISNGQQNLAVMLTMEHEYAEAGPLYVEALAERRRTFGPDKPRTLKTEENYGALLYAEGHDHAAENMLEDMLRRSRKTLPPDHPFVAEAERRLALTLSALGMNDSAKAMATRSVDTWLKRADPDNIQTLRSLRALGLVDAAAGDSVAAESLLMAAYDSQRAYLGPDHPDTRETARDLAALYRAWGRPREAARYLADGTVTKG